MDIFKQPSHHARNNETIKYCMHAQGCMQRRGGGGGAAGAVAPPEISVNFFWGVSFF